MAVTGDPYRGIERALMAERDTAKRELDVLRLSIQRVAELARVAGADVTIPNKGDERGWNRLCAQLVDYIDEIIQADNEITGR